MELQFTLGQEVRLYHPDGAYNEGDVVAINLGAKQPNVDVDFGNWTERFKKTSFSIMYSHFMDPATGDYPAFLIITKRGIKLNEFVKVRPGEQ